MATTVESSRERRHLVREAGFPATSFVSVVAGFLVAIGTIALLGAIAAAVGSELGISTDGVSTDEWRQAGIGGTVAAAVVGFLAFLFGGYTAGRMGRRAGARHGLLVFLLFLVIAGVVATLAAAFGDANAAEDTLQDANIPTDGDTWSDIGIGAAIAVPLAMLLGSLLGGIKGEKWHGKLVGAYADRHDTTTVHDADRDHTMVDRDHDGRDGRDDRTEGRHFWNRNRHDDTVDLRDDQRTLSVEEERELNRR